MRTNLPARLASLVLISVATCCPARAVGIPEAELGLVPQPAHLELKAGDWTLKPTARIVAGGAAAREANKLADALSVPLGRRISVVSGPVKAGDIEMTLDASDTQLGTEGYRLSITPDRVLLRGVSEAGLFYAGVTFRQLLPAAIFRTAGVAAAPGPRRRLSRMISVTRRRHPFLGLPRASRSKTFHDFPGGDCCSTRPGISCRRNSSSSSWMSWRCTN